MVLIAGGVLAELEKITAEPPCGEPVLDSCFHTAPMTFPLPRLTSRLSSSDAHARAATLRASCYAFCSFTELGRKLFDALPSITKRFVELEGAGHNDIPYHDPSRYLREVSAFLREARAKACDV